MVSLKYIKNPFTDDYLNSFECFRYEKLFFNCLTHDTMDSDDVFDNLGHSFYTYLLTGDNDEWIGYVLFHNEEFIKSYLNSFSNCIKAMLLKLKTLIHNQMIINEIEIIFLNLNRNKLTINDLPLLNDKITILMAKCIDEDVKFSSYFEDCYYKIKNFIYQFDEYYNLDIVIGLPIDTDRNKIEDIYYGFVREAYQRVEELIKENFNDIPIVLRNTNSSLCLVNNDNKIKVLDKKDIARS